MVEYKVEDKILLSAKNLTWQMRNREIKKLIEKFVILYKIKEIKEIISKNAVKLELLVLIKIYLIVNISRIAIYQEHVEGQKKIPPPIVKIDRKKEYEVEKILNKRDMRGKLKYLVRWKEYTVEEDIWEELENLGNTIDLVEEFKKIREKKIRKVQIRKEKKKKKENILNPETEMFKKSELLEKYTVKILFRWNDRKFEDEYLKKLERSQIIQKEKERQVSLEVEP